MIEHLHPGLILMLGAWLVPFLKGKLRKAYLVALPVAALIATVLLQPGVFGRIPFLGQELVLIRADKLGLVFCWVFALMSVIGCIYALHVDDTAQHVAALTYAGGGLGVALAGDFLSFFVFWELMSAASVLLVWLRREAPAVRAGFRYLLVHSAGGMCLLGGIFLHYSASGSLALGPVPAGSPEFVLILLGFLVNAAVPPLGAWLPDAYPEATVTGAIFMTAYTTKSAVYALIRCFPGTELLVWLGAVMALYGVVYAVLENDARRLLAYHIISQVGYMVCGVGIGTELALNGAAAHAFAHILYKSLLFMGAGAVIHMTGKHKLSEMGGLYKTMPITMILYMVGAFAISAVPLWSGFVSKTMVIAAAGETHRMWIFLMLTMASCGTFLHTGLKLPYYMFFGKDSGMRPKEPPVNMLLAMGIGALACTFIGIFPGKLYHLLPFHVDYAPYTWHHVTGELGLLGFTALGFVLLLRKLDPELTISLDTDWFYRLGAPLFMRWAAQPIAKLEYGFVGEIYEFVIRKPVLGLSAAFRVIDSVVVDGTLVGLGLLTRRTSSGFRPSHTGNAQTYGLVMALGMILALAAAAVIW